MKDNFIIFQSYIDIFELKPAKNGGNHGTGVKFRPQILIVH